MRDYGVFTISHDGNVSSWESSAESIFGYGNEEVIGQPVSIFYTPEDALNGAPELEMQTVEAEGWAVCERWYVRKDGTRFLGSSVVAPVVGVSGGRRGFVKVTYDVTGCTRAEESLGKDQKSLEAGIEERTAVLLRANVDLQERIAERERIENALRQSEERYRAFVTNSSEAIWRFALEQPVPLSRFEDEQIECFYQLGYLAECNGVMARMYNFSSPEEMVGIRLGDIVVRSNPENIAFLRDFIRAGYRLIDAETVEVDKEGKTKYFLNNLVGIVEGGYVLGAWGANRDITEIRRAEEALRKSEARFRIAAEMASDLIYEWDVKDRRMEWIGDVDQRLGCRTGEFPRTVAAWEHALHPSDHNRVMIAIERQLATGAPLCEEYRIRNKDGDYLYWTDSRRALSEENSGSHKWIGVISDITRRKEAEEAQSRLRLAVLQSAEEWQLTFNAIQYPVLILDFAGRIIQSNRAADEVSSIAEGTCAGLYVDQIGHGLLWQKAAEMVRVAPKTRLASSCIITDEDTAETWDIAVNLLPISKSDAGRVIIVARDITRQVELEASLRHSELMAALGSLVASVAHEVRNPLFGISSVLDAFDARFGDLPDRQKYISVLREELGHLNRLMEDLIDYGKSFGQEFRPGSIYDAIVAGITACVPLAEQGQVQIVNNAPKALAPIMMDEKRLPQVFSNLIKNAIQHSSPGAAVLIESDEILLDNKSWVECRVMDSGPGFEIADLPRIFDPFFTRRSGGTGLGLSIVQRIVREHGGKITAGNHSAGGAELVIRIPIECGS